MKRLCNVFLFLFLLLPSIAQKFEYNAGMWNFADNREYTWQKTRSKTYLAAQTWAEVGFRLDSIHRFMAGVNYMYEYGSHNPLQYGFPIAYYHARYRSINFYAGAFERKNKLQYPLALLSDTVNYFRPNMEGLLFSYEKNGLRQNIWLDWTSRQGEIHREIFLAGISGQMEWGSVFLNHYFVLCHYAGTLNRQPDVYLRDNAAVNVNLGYNLNQRTALDTLSFSLGILTGIDRNRQEGIWHTPSGLIAQANAFWKFAGTAFTYYHGPGLDVMMGDALYLDGNYGRADFYFIPFRKGNVNARLVFSWHYHRGDISSTQQALSIDVRLNPGI